MTTASPASAPSTLDPQHPPLRIGAHVVDSIAIQGALSGYSDAPMRKIARRFGARYAMHEVVLDALVVQPGKLQREILHVDDDDHPVAGQLLGATPETFAEAARLLAGAGYDTIDVNLGCPVKKVLGRHRGGYLLSEPETALAILARVRDAVPPPVPLTVKMRRGLDDTAQSEDNFWRIAEGAFALGVDAICVHGRSVLQRYIGPSRWSFVKAVKERFPTRTILGSGDIFTAEDAVRMKRETGVDGVWVARGSIGAPWIFREIDALWRTGDRGPPPSMDEQIDAVTTHQRLLVETLGRERGLRMLRKFAIHYGSAHPQAAVVERAFIECRVVDDVEATVAMHYAPGRDYGPVVHRTAPATLIAAGAAA